MAGPESELVEIGKIGKPHGLNGEVRFWAYNPDSEIIAPGLVITCVTPNQTADFEITRLRWRERFALVRLKGLRHKDELTEWTNATCHVPREAFPEPEEGEFYLVDLLNLPVFASQTSQDEPREVGHVEGFIETGANDVIRVSLSNNRSLLVPFVMGYAVAHVDVSEGVTLAPLDEWAPEGTELEP